MARRTDELKGEEAQLEQLTQEVARDLWNQVERRRPSVFERRWWDEHILEWAMADESVKEICGVSHRLPSGPLHDAAEVCRTGVPTVMLFVQSLHGISHNKIEDTREEHIEMSVRALDRLADKTMQWIIGGGAAAGSRKST